MIELPEARLNGSRDKSLRVCLRPYFLFARPATPAQSRSVVVTGVQLRGLSEAQVLKHEAVITGDIHAGEMGSGGEEERKGSVVLPLSHGG